MNPFTLPLDVHRRQVESFTETMSRARVAPDRVQQMASAEVGQTPSEVVYTENKLELRRYEPLTEVQHDVPILLVYALINRPYILDLQPDRSVVRRLLEAGHDVYLVDWNEPSQLDAHLTLSDYITRYLDNCVDEVCSRSDQSAVNLLGYCMGGTMAAIYAALEPDRVNALALLATGTYFDDTGGVLERWGDEAYFDPSAAVASTGILPGAGLATGFALMDPVANYVTKYLRLFDRLENEDFVRNFARMERWLADDIDVAGAAYATFVEDIYQDNLLYRNEFELDGTPVDVTNIDMPLLQILGEYDNLVPPAASKPFNDVVGSDDVTTIEYPTGHVGLSVSRSTHNAVWPEVAEWFTEQSATPALADVVGEGVEEVLGVDVETDVTEGRADEVAIRIADENGLIAQSLVALDADAIKAFVEDALDVRLGLELSDGEISVTVDTGDDVRTIVVESVGAAIREEVEEAVADVDLAARHELEDVDGIGPTYADRLRDAGVDTVVTLAAADVDAVAEVADASPKLARRWRNHARELVGFDT